MTPHSLDQRHHAGYTCCPLFLLLSTVKFTLRKNCMINLIQWLTQHIGNEGLLHWVYNSAFSLLKAQVFSKCYVFPCTSWYTSGNSLKSLSLKFHRKGNEILFCWHRSVVGSLWPKELQESTDSCLMEKFCGFLTTFDLRPHATMHKLTERHSNATEVWVLLWYRIALAPLVTYVI